MAFGSSRQHHYGAVDQEESRPGALVSTEKVALMSKRKLNGSPQLLIPGVPQVSLEWGFVWGPLGTFSPKCLESPTPGPFPSEGSLFFSMVLCSPDKESGEA